MKLIYLITLGLFVLSACQNPGSSFDSEKLLGNWECVRLFQNNEEQNFMLGTIRFTFNADSSYLYQGGLYKETGRWWVEADKLHTQAEDELEKIVQISSMDSAMLILEMNDRGQQMRMELEKRF